MPFAGLFLRLHQPKISYIARYAPDFGLAHSEKNPAQLSQVIYIQFLKNPASGPAKAFVYGFMHSSLTGAGNRNLLCCLHTVLHAVQHQNTVPKCRRLSMARIEGISITFSLPRRRRSPPCIKQASPVIPVGFPFLRPSNQQQFMDCQRHSRQ